jgi:heavy metal sensor kinase
MRLWHSIQWRILTYYTGLVGLAIVLLIAVFYLFERKEHEHLTELKLQRSAILLIPFQFAPGPPGRPLAGGETSDREQHRQQALEQLRQEKVFWYAAEIDGTPMDQSENFPEELATLIHARGPGAVWDYVETDAHFLMLHRLPRRGYVAVGTSKAAVIAELNQLLIYSAGIGLLVTIATSAIGFWIVRASLKPIGLISKTAERIATGDLSERIDARNVRDELGQLADVLNITFARLGDALKRQIQFTSDASHELRTPVAAILADCQFSLKRERSAERYRETIEVCHESAQHMRALIEDLRELADFDEKSEALVSEPVEIRDFMSSILGVMTPLAEEKKLLLKGDLEEGVAHLDPMRMRQAIINILNNAIRYTASGGRIDVGTVTGKDRIRITIRDTGIGIEPEKLPHIFDRFYRADEARDTHTGGVGLGLSITKSIVEANGGRITVESEPGVGTCFRVELPIA